MFVCHSVKVFAESVSMLLANTSVSAHFRGWLPLLKQLQAGSICHLAIGYAIKAASWRIERCRSLATCYESAQATGCHSWWTLLLSQKAPACAESESCAERMLQSSKSFYHLNWETLFNWQYVGFRLLSSDQLLHSLFSVSKNWLKKFQNSFVKLTRVTPQYVYMAFKVWSLRNIVYITSKWNSLQPEPKYHIFFYEFNIRLKNTQTT